MRIKPSTLATSKGLLAFGVFFAVTANIHAAPNLTKAQKAELDRYNAAEAQKEAQKAELERFAEQKCAPKTSPGTNYSTYGCEEGAREAALQMVGGDGCKLPIKLQTASEQMFSCSKK